MSGTRTVATRYVAPVARSVRSVGLAGMVVVALAACGGPEPSTAALDACNIFASRTAEAPERADLIDATAPSVEEAAEQTLKDAHEVLTAAQQGDATQWREAVAAFSETCISLGWELPEG